ncbi:DUF4097 domain-containing protein [Dyadobacter sp. CY343]|uniref:DUF4097 domain-containing protein n=1 Tax=Dyadobacter sp. CY343 TaxID=2907299 RepID=UPI001F45965A|nr:DUF4097 domain-containing protein [Dyadobacter sp. CY343]MCE7062019.1 DUF4097 domain-containing protein [Dyadobacter sp. CY343]
MKDLFRIICICLCTTTLFAQKKIDKTLPYKSGQIVNLELKFADSIKVRYWDKDEALVKMDITINGGRLNDALVIRESQTSDEVKLSTDLDEKILDGSLESDCPETKQGRWTNKEGKSRYLCKTIHYQVFLPKNAQLKLETIDGNIDIEGASSPVSAKTISGYVDMNWPGTKGANIAMKTITGEVYSDLNIDFKNKKEKNPIVGYLLEGTIQGGGPDVRLESISNNVYLRQKK